MQTAYLRPYDGRLRSIKDVKNQTQLISDIKYQEDCLATMVNERAEMRIHPNPGSSSDLKRVQDLQLVFVAFNTGVIEHFEIVAHAAGLWA